MLGIAVDNDGNRSTSAPSKAVIVGTGGSTSNVNFRRMFDPRLTKIERLAVRHKNITAGMYWLAFSGVNIANLGFY